MFEKKIKWTSSKKSVATVNNKGVVVAKKKGVATITAKIGKKKYKCKVTVNNKPKGSNKSQVVNQLLCEDKTIKVYLKEIKNGWLVLDVTNKSSKDYYFGVSFLKFNGNCFYDDFTVDTIYANKTKQIIIDNDFFKCIDNPYDNYCFTGGTLSGRFYYYKDNDETTGINFNKTIKTSLPNNNTQTKKFSKSLLCKDNNISVYKVSHTNNTITFLIENHTKTDYTFGVSYLEFGGKTYYDEFNVADIYASTYRLFENDEYNLGNFTYKGEHITGRVYYHDKDSNEHFIMIK